jgi:hypothetical protein
MIARMTPMRAIIVGPPSVATIVGWRLIDVLKIPRPCADGARAGLIPHRNQRPPGPLGGFFVARGIPVNSCAASCY